MTFKSRPGQANQVHQIDQDTFVSYSPPGANPLVTMMDEILGVSEETAHGETAVVLDGKRFLILKGDWRSHYDKCQTREEALSVFRENIEHIGPTSDLEEDVQ